MCTSLSSVPPTSVILPASVRFEINLNSFFTRVNSPTLAHHSPTISADNKKTVQEREYNSVKLSALNFIPGSLKCEMFPAATVKTLQNSLDNLIYGHFSALLQN